ncbi:MAG: helix-turn-helix transcriptional regulator [Caldilineaceae bacterium]|nr:helix-turn-helix transcriptional regulator [Caldilineaceae bacterium]
MSEETTYFHERLRERRESAGLVQEKAGELLGYSKSYLSKLEAGVSVPTGWPLLSKLASAYDTSADYLLGLTDNPMPERALSPVLHEIVDTAAGLSGLHQRVVLIVARSFESLGVEMSPAARLELQEMLLDQIEDFFGEEIADKVIDLLSAGQE